MEEENIEYNEDEYDVTDIVIEDNDDKTMIDILRKYKKHKKNYKTSPALTKYEKCRVLSERASQINCGGQIYIANSDRFSNAYDIAVQEFNEKRRIVENKPDDEDYQDLYIYENKIFS